MSNSKDDLEAVRVIAEMLEPFDEAVRERILKWARERLETPPAKAPSPAEKAARTRGEKAEKRSEAARKANKTRGKKGRSEAAKKAAATRRARQVA